MIRPLQEPSLAGGRGQPRVAMVSPCRTPSASVVAAKSRDRKHAAGARKRAFPFDLFEPLAAIFGLGEPDLLAFVGPQPMLAARHDRKRGALIDRSDAWRGCDGERLTADDAWRFPDGDNSPAVAGHMLARADAPPFATARMD